MADVRVFLFRSSNETCRSATGALPNHWVYWREGKEDTRILHSDSKAMLTQLKQGGDPRKPADYCVPFRARIGAAAFVFVRPDKLDPTLPGEHTERELTVHLLQREELSFRVAPGDSCVIRLLSPLRNQGGKEGARGDDASRTAADAGAPEPDKTAAIFVKTVVNRIKPAIQTIKSARGRPGVLACASRVKGEPPPCKFALTFDDGPNPKTTPMVLDVLKAFKAPALFFVLGDRFDYSDRSDLSMRWGKYINRFKARYPTTEPFNKPNDRATNAAIVTRMMNEGHQIGLHMYWHAPHTLMQKEAGAPGLMFDGAVASLIRAEEAVCAFLASLPKSERCDARRFLRNLVRLPYGDGSRDNDMLSAIHKSDYRHVYWDYDTADWDVEAHPWRREYLAENLMNDACARAEHNQLGGVALFHDVRTSTAERLEEWLKKLRQAGHEFVSIDEVVASSTSFSQTKLGFVDPWTRKKVFSLHETTK